MSELTVMKDKFYELIQNFVEFSKISHAYLIEVDNYNDDFRCVLDFVKLILCQKNAKRFTSLNCNHCNICKQIDDGNYLDLKVIEPIDGMIRKPQLEELQKEFVNKSFLDNKMIYIIKEAELLNESAGNTILKFLEEPEDNIVAILVTKNRYKVLDTILSRCQVISLQEVLNCNEVNDKVVEFISFMVNSADLFIKYQYIFTSLMPDKVAAKELLIQVENAIVGYLEQKAIKNGNFNLELEKIFAKRSVNELTNYIAIIEEELKKLEYNINYKLWLDCLFARLIGG